MTREPGPDDAHIRWRDLLESLSVTVGDRNTARWMCETASGADGDEFRGLADAWVPERAGLHIESMTRRLLAGEPLQYVLGRWGFRRLDLMVDRRVLIPRPETELIVDHVLAHLRAVDRATVVADLGTGSGAIGLSVLFEMPPGSVTVWMTDESGDALDVARANAAGTGRAAAGACFAQGSWYDALPSGLRGGLDVVVSNPPYVADSDGELAESVRRWEPTGALLAGADGLDDLRVIADGAREWLAPGGVLITEIGHTQAAAVTELFAGAGLSGAEVLADLAGRDRFVVGRRV